jgi:hypothetical protein
MKMTVDSHATFPVTIGVRDELGLGRTDEPVRFPLRALYAHLPQRLALRDDRGAVVAFQIIGRDAAGAVTADSSLVFLASLAEGVRERRYRLEEGDGTLDGGICQLSPDQPDGVRRLDTGTYVVELCRGQANGSTAGKWGVRHFAESDGGESLIKDSSNALGGVYGPYFTPENGLINPPEHAIADVTVVEEGPLLCQYQLDIAVPNGLDPALHGARIQVVWTFYHRSRWVDRRYTISHYDTVIDGMRVSNLMTVGDEFEGGQGRLLFSRFAAYPETLFRGGDPYSLVLNDVLEELLDAAPRDGSPDRDEFHDAFAGGIRNASYDWYWRPLSVRESFIDSDLIRERLDVIRDRAGAAMREAIVGARLRRADAVDVSAEPEQTAFVRTATKSAMLEPDSGYAVVWCTSQPVRRFQIVQRPQSGWVNWGTNGENEFPELPSGTTIRMAYGPTEDWTVDAARMESPLAAYVVPARWGDVPQ